MVYLALTYDHRIVDGADAARFLVTVKERLEEGAFEAELGLVERASMKVAVTGSSGLIGSALTASPARGRPPGGPPGRRPPRASDAGRTRRQRGPLGSGAARRVDPAAGRRRRRRAPGRRRRGRPPLDRQLQGGDPGQPGRSPPRPWPRAAGARRGTARPKTLHGRLRDRLVRRHRRPRRSTRARPAGQGVPRARRARLGGRRRPGPRRPASGSPTCAAAWCSARAAACSAGWRCPPGSACGRASATGGR